MKLYKPVLIETAEQAEALPAGTLAWHSEGTGVDHAHKVAPLPGHHEGGWITLTGYAVNFQIIGWSALVPIEAEERIGSEMCHQISDKRYDIHVLPAGDEKQARWQIENNPDYATGRIMRQYRTPWEEA